VGTSKCGLFLDFKISELVHRTTIRSLSTPANAEIVPEKESLISPLDSLAFYRPCKMTMC